MKKYLNVFIILLFVLLTGCNRYVSHYQATLFAHSNTLSKASMSFYSFKGIKVFSLRTKENNKKLFFNAKLEEGSAFVYFDCEGSKTLLFTIYSNDEINDFIENIPKGTTYIIVETQNKCMNGEFNFYIE